MCIRDRLLLFILLVCLNASSLSWHLYCNVAATEVYVLIHILTIWKVQMIRLGQWDSNGTSLQFIHQNPDTIRNGLTTVSVGRNFSQKNVGKYRLTFDSCILVGKVLNPVAHETGIGCGQTSTSFLWYNSNLAKFFLHDNGWCGTVL